MSRSGLMGKTHKHKWGPWFSLARWAQRIRFCVDGWCPMGQKRNGWIFVARPDRGNPANILRRSK